MLTVVNNAPSFARQSYNIYNIESAHNGIPAHSLRFSNNLDDSLLATGKKEREKE